MNLFRRLIEFLKKIGVLQAGVTTKTYKRATDTSYEVDLDTEE